MKCLSERDGDGRRETRSGTAHRKQFETDVSAYDVVFLSLVSVFPQKQRCRNTHLGVLRSGQTTTKSDNREVPIPLRLCCSSSLKV